MSLWITLSSAFTFMRQSARFWPTGIVVMLGTAQVAVVQADAGEALFASDSALREWLAGNPGLGVAVIIGAAVFVAGAWLLSEMATGVLVVAGDAPLQGRHLSVREAWREGRRVWLRIVAVDLLVVVPALTPIVTLLALATAAADAGKAAELSLGLLDFMTVGIYSGFAVVLAIVVWAWRDLALRHAVLGGERPMEAVHAAVSDLTGSWVRTMILGSALFVASYVATVVLLPLLLSMGALGITGAIVFTPSLAWQWVLVPGAVLLGPYALFDTAAWTYFYRLLHPTVAEASDV